MITVALLEQLAGNEFEILLWQHAEGDRQVARNRPTLRLLAARFGKEDPPTPEDLLAEIEVSSLRSASESSTTASRPIARLPDADESESNHTAKPANFRLRTLAAFR
ncbi:hypothetical protein [Allosphingosinicella deserti]|uniref:hypothetical protein n=1 Tax=Allosphingosinicella deserti TaxID=2116704 RepID=UPI0011B27CC9|nr:hypothetical protein [Sphingomonas deserti]